MKNEKFLEKQLADLLNKGSDKQDLLNLKGKIENTIQYIDDRDKEEIISGLEQEIIEESQKFLQQHNDLNQELLTALSTCIYLPDFKTGDYKIKFISGKNSSGIDVNDSTLFDVASITKMYSLLLIFKLAEFNIISLNDKISDLDSDFSNLGDFTINDLIRMCGELYTNGAIKNATTKEEAYEILKTVCLKSNDRSRNQYTDLGMIVLSKVIEKKVSEYLGQTLTYDQIMNKYILEPFGLSNTQFNPSSSNVAGNANDMSLVHDPKSRILGGAVGSAGIFTNADDLAKLAKEMYRVTYADYNSIKNIVSPQNLQMMGTVIFPDSPQNNKGLVGLYQKNMDREKKWLQPLVYADQSFTAQGFTGAVATFDPKNKIHNSFLFDSIKTGENNKPDGFMQAFNVYQKFIVGETITLYIVKKYYDQILKDNSYDKTI